jgi:hypothetical protein
MTTSWPTTLPLPTVQGYVIRPDGETLGRRYGLNPAAGEYR